MNKIKLITDSTCDLSEEIIKRLDLEVLPLIVTFPNKEYRDGVDLKTNELYEIVKETNVLPKTSAISFHPFYDVFKKYVDLGYDILYTGIGSKLSACFQNALTAKEEGNFENVYLVDSCNLSTATGLILLKMDQCRKKGMSAREIKQEMEEKIVPNIRCSFAIKSMDYLHKGGRCSGITKFLGTWLKIKPIIKVDNGKLDVYKTPRGTIKKAIEVIYQDALDVKDKIDPDFFFITHTEAFESVDFIYPFVKNNINPKELFVTEAGCVIGSHCGPETLGLLYIVKE